MPATVLLIDANAEDEQLFREELALVRGQPFRLQVVHTLAEALARLAPDLRQRLEAATLAGIGAGIVLDGALFRGARGWSGELGHVPVHPDGVACRCGGQGCLERYAGQEAILRAILAIMLEEREARAASRPRRPGRPWRSRFSRRPRPRRGKRVSVPTGSPCWRTRARTRPDSNVRRNASRSTP